jgi:hypothetical protein
VFKASDSTLARRGPGISGVIESPQEPSGQQSLRGYDHGIMTIALRGLDMRKMAADLFKTNRLEVINEVEAKHKTS